MILLLVDNGNKNQVGEKYLLCVGRRIVTMESLDICCTYTLRAHTMKYIILYTVILCIYYVVQIISPFDDCKLMLSISMYYLRISVANTT